MRLAVAGRPAKPRQEPRIPDDFAFNFVADWPPLLNAHALPMLADGWTLRGTVTKNRSTHPWGHGMIAACGVGGRLVALTATAERSRIGFAVEFRQQRGWESMPKPRTPAGATRPMVNLGPQADGASAGTSGVTAVDRRNF